MTRGATFRGQPLLLLAALLVGWVALRVAMWQPAFDSPDVPLGVVAEVDRPIRVTGAMTTGPEGAIPEFRSRPDRRMLSVPVPLEPVVPPPLEPVRAFGARTDFPPAATPRRTAAAWSPARAVVGHNLLLMAALSRMDAPSALMGYRQGPEGTPGVPAAGAPLVVAPSRPALAAASRWSADAWLLLRNDTATPVLSGRPVYGRSQAGAVLRYRLGSMSPLRPRAYLRAGAALAGEREREVAAGLSARPIAGLPLRLAAEARVTETASGTSLRPAAFVVSEFPPVDLPLGLRGEAYAQAGYVGGDFASAFVDGQARIERRVAGRGGTELSVGAGAWGGAQKGSARLDIGPGAAVSFRLGEARARLAADYRLRVAGEAEPASGPAVTLSAGF